MTIPLNQVQKIKKKASKPGELWDEYVKVQDINNAVRLCKKDIARDFTNVHVQEIIFDKIDKWISVINNG